MRGAPPPQSQHNLRWHRSCVRGFHFDEVAWTRIAQPFLHDKWLKNGFIGKTCTVASAIAICNFKQFCLKVDLRYSNAFEGHGCLRFHTLKNIVLANCEGERGIAHFQDMHFWYRLWRIKYSIESYFFCWFLHVCRGLFIKKETP